MSLCLSKEVILLWHFNSWNSPPKQLTIHIAVSDHILEECTPSLFSPLAQTIVCTQGFNALAFSIYRFPKCRAFFLTFGLSCCCNFFCSSALLQVFSKANQKPIMMMTLKEGKVLRCLADFAQCSFLYSRKNRVLSDLQFYLCISDSK